MPNPYEQILMALQGQGGMQGPPPMQGGMAGAMPQAQPDYGGGGVPVGDVWRQPSGRYAPMSPMELMMKDFMAWAFGRGYAGQAATTLEDERNRLRNALDEANRR